MLKEAAMRLQRALHDRVGEDCTAVTRTVQAFIAEARASNANPFDLIPIYRARFEEQYGEALKSLRHRQPCEAMPQRNNSVPGRKPSDRKSHRRIHNTSLANARKRSHIAGKRTVIQGFAHTPTACDLALLDRLFMLGTPSFSLRMAAFLLASDLESARASLERLVAVKLVKRLENGHYCLTPFMRLLAQEQIAFTESVACSRRFSRQYIQ
jgi:hypothetical protein